MFKIKDGVRIGTIDVLNNSGNLLSPVISGDTTVYASTADKTTDAVKLKGRAGGSGSWSVSLTPATLSANQTLTLPNATGTLALTTDIGDGALTVTVDEVGTTGNSVYITTGTGFSANDSAAVTYDIHVGPALKNLADFMTGAGSGFIKKNGQDTYLLDTSTYLTTQYSSKNIVGASNTATANATATNGNVFINHLEDTTVTSAHKITGAGGTTVTSDASGNITITSTDTNTDTLQSVTAVEGNTEKFIHFVANSGGAQTAESSYNLKFTPGNAVSPVPTLLLGGVTSSSPVITTTSTGTVSLFNTNATAVNAFGAATAISIGASTGTTTVNNSLVVSGNLTVNGTTTSINNSTITVDDKNLELGSVVAVTGLTGTITTAANSSTITGLATTSGLIPGMALTKTSGTGAFGTGTVITSVDSATQITVTGSSAQTVGSITFSAGGATDVTADGGGITIKGTTNKTWNWVDATDAWTSSEHINLLTGKAYYINGTAVLSATTLGSGVTSSSLTKVGLTSAGYVKTDASGNLSASATLGAADLTGTIPSAVLGNSTLYVGTTAIALNRARWAQSLTGITGVASDSTLTIASATTYAITVDSGTTGGVNLGTGANAKAIAIGNSTVASTIALNNNTTLPAGKTLTLSGSTSGTVELQATAVSGTNTITLPAATGIVALTTDIKDGQLTATTPSAGATNTAVDLSFSATYSANTATNTTVKAVVGPSLTALAGIMTGASVGFLKKTAQDTYALDTSTYLTSQSNDFGTVTVSDTDSGHTWAATGSAVADAVGDTLTVVSGRGVDVDVSATTDAIRISSAGSAYSYSDAITVTQTAPSANTAFNVTSWTKADFRAIKFIIGVSQGTTLYQTSEIMVFNDGTTTGQMTEYAVFSNDAAKEVTYTIDFAGATAYLKASTPTATTDVVFKIHRTFIAI